MNAIPLSALCILTGFAWVGIVLLIDRFVGYYFEYKDMERRNELDFEMSVRDEIDYIIDSL